MTAKKKDSAEPAQPDLWVYMGSLEKVYPGYLMTLREGRTETLRGIPGGTDPVKIQPVEQGDPVPPDGDWVAFSGKMGDSKTSETDGSD